jgi:hypothetical protein
MATTRTVSLPLDEYDYEVTLRPPTVEQWRASVTAENRADGLRDLALACVPSEMASRLLELEQDYPAILYHPSLAVALGELSGASVKPATPSPTTNPGRRHRVVAFSDPSGAEHTWVLVPPSVTGFRAFRDTAGTDPDATLLLVEECTKQVVGETPRALVERYPGILDSPTVSIPMGELTGLVASERKKG